MSTVNDPLFGFEARGSLKGELTFRKTRSGVVISRYVAPDGQPTEAQVKKRTRFRTLLEMWAFLLEDGRLPWKLFSARQSFTALNSFLGKNLSEIADDEDLSNFLASPGAGGAIQPDAVLAMKFPDPGTILISVNIPIVPSDWEMMTVNAVAFPNQNPSAPFMGPLIITTGTEGELVVLVEGLPSNTECMVGVWLTWRKPNGQLAYSRSRPALAPVTTAGPETNYVIGPDESTNLALVLFDNETGNLLKDSQRPYAEGISWNPVLKFGGNDVGISYVGRGARYTLIGDSVFVSGYFQLSSKGSSTGNATVSLPVSSINESLAGFLNIPAYFNMNNATPGGFQAFVQPGAAAFAVVEPGLASHVAVTDARFTNSSWLFFAGLYRVPPI